MRTIIISGCCLLLAACLLAPGCGTTDELIKPGTQAPDVTGRSSDGSAVRIRDFQGSKQVVLFIYPKDDTPESIQDAAAFRDNMQTFQNLETVVFGVSTSGIATHKQFSSKYNLNYPLLADEEGDFCRAFGVPVYFGMAKRTTIIIGANGVVKKVFYEPSTVDHIKEVIEALQAG